jgi:preprotein translocase subunit SecG
MLRMILTCVQVFSALVIVGLVLLQRGKGAEAGAGFGAGASGTVFGARGATTALSRATAIFAAIFMLNSLWLAYLGTTVARDAAEQKTLLDEAAVKTKATGGAAAPVVPPAAVPGTTPTTTPPATPPPSAPK